MKRSDDNEKRNPARYIPNVSFGAKNGDITIYEKMIWLTLLY